MYQNAYAGDYHPSPKRVGPGDIFPRLVQVDAPAAARQNFIPRQEPYRPGRRGRGGYRGRGILMSGRPSSRGSSMAARGGRDVLVEENLGRYGNMPVAVDNRQDASQRSISFAVDVAKDRLTPVGQRAGVPSRDDIQSSRSGRGATIVEQDLGRYGFVSDGVDPRRNDPLSRFASLAVDVSKTRPLPTGPRSGSSSAALQSQSHLQHQQQRQEQRPPLPPLPPQAPLVLHRQGEPPRSSDTLDSLDKLLQFSANIDAIRQSVSTDFELAQLASVAESFLRKRTGSQADVTPPKMGATVTTQQQKEKVFEPEEATAGPRPNAVSASPQTRAAQLKEMILGKTRKVELEIKREHVASPVDRGESSSLDESPIFRGENTRVMAPMNGHNWRQRSTSPNKAKKKQGWAAQKTFDNSGYQMSGSYPAHRDSALLRGRPLDAAPYTTDESVYVPPASTYAYARQASYDENGRYLAPVGRPAQPSWEGAYRRDAFPVESPRRPSGPSPLHNGPVHTMHAVDPTPTIGRDVLATLAALKEQIARLEAQLPASLAIQQPVNDRSSPNGDRQRDSARSGTAPEPHLAVEGGSVRPPVREGYHPVGPRGRCLSAARHSVPNQARELRLNDGSYGTDSKLGYGGGRHVSLSPMRQDLRYGRDRHHPYARQQGENRSVRGGFSGRGSSTRGTTFYRGRGR